MTTEQHARSVIDRLLAQAGWTFTTEKHAPDSGRAGFADYILYAPDGTAVALLEAKAAGKHPLVGKEQARDYAKALGIGWIILSNGGQHYVWDTRSGDPARALSIPTPQVVANGNANPPRARARLWTTPITPDYLQRAAPGARAMRDYQVTAIHAVQQSAEHGETAFLLEMATGTGKTTVAAAFCFLYLNTGNARRILFLVDRIELRQQAAQDIRDAINNQYTVAAYAGNPEHDWDHTRVTVTTIQSIEALHQNGLPIRSDHFDLIITDEAHRCISGPNHRRLFEYFTAEKIGLTATPRTFVNADAVADDDTSAAAREQRAIRDTYHAFGLNPGQPTYSYTIEQGVADGYLVRPTAVDVRTEVTAGLMSDAGYQVTLFDYDAAGGDLELTYRARDFARTFLSQGTNAEFARVYIAEALQETGTDLIGKGIIYAVNQSHAALLTQALNEAAAEIWPGVYQSDFAVQVTSDVRDANEHGQRFKNNAGNGRHPAIAGYQTAKTRVCVTVAMMTTGYDCPDLLNIGICRPIKSPTDFTQIKGRGTRRYDFRDNFTDPLVRQAKPPRPKERFKIVDFFGVCEYHHEGHYYEPRRSVPALEPSEPDPEPPSGGQPLAGRGVYVRHGADETASLTRLTFENNAATIADRQEDARYNLRRRQESVNDAVAAAFAAYISEYPIGDATARENARALFEAYATDAAVRERIDAGQYAALAGTALEPRRYRDTQPEHRARIPAYVRTHLLDETRAA